MESLHQQLSLGISNGVSCTVSIDVAAAVVLIEQLICEFAGPSATLQLVVLCDDIDIAGALRVTQSVQKAPKEAAVVSLSKESFLFQERRLFLRMKHVTAIFAINGVIGREDLHQTTNAVFISFTSTGGASNAIRLGHQSETSRIYYYRLQSPALVFTLLHKIRTVYSARRQVIIVSDAVTVHFAFKKRCVLSECFTSAMSPRTRALALQRYFSNHAHTLVCEDLVLEISTLQDVNLIVVEYREDRLLHDTLNRIQQLNFRGDLVVFSSERALAMPGTVELDTSFRQQRLGTVGIKQPRRDACDL
ncbi:hypothetical protein SS50377_25883 [Spironucleus salmonicida]|uniref:Uncharacterized protein n=1 Tax=Spironucleus salmonicida TaxID=348837 RepID=V6LUB6_9EUKA|nr:hypothetical protein SS50377_25883 [Spironucleus salmonicida]|eukprot:EST48217.1 Hypothetical protein SS50377_11659 [Spironucleus salmonicida]